MGREEAKDHLQLGDASGQTVRMRMATRRQDGPGWQPWAQGGPKPELKKSRQEAILGMHWTLQSWPLRPEP